MAPCSLCPPEQPRRAILRRPKTLQPVCKECFFEVFETEVHHTIMGYGQAEQSHKKRKGKAVAREGASEPEEEEEQEVPKKVLFKRGERVAIGASGGKDSTVLAYIMTLLNERYDYGLDLCLLSIDEGISGYRDASLDTVKRNAEQYGLPLKILSYSELYQGWTMDKVVAEVGKKGNCTYCGVFRRQALDRGAHILTVDHIVTGHNADDVAETVLMNVLRGDISRLERCTAITTGGDVDPSPTNDPSSSDPSDLESLLPRTIKRSKPFKYAYEKEIVMYAYFKKLDYHSTECIYAPTAYRGYARALVKDLEAIRPSAIVDLIYSGEAMAASLNLRGRRAGGDPDPNEVANAPPKKGITKATKKGAKQVQQKCQRCQSLSSQPLCQACMLLESLNSHTSLLSDEMGKRASSPEGQPVQKTSKAPAEADRTAIDEEGMGEFEDQWEDEFEDDAELGEVVDAGEETGDEDGEGEGGMELDQPEEEERPASPVPFLPTGKLEEGEFLAPDLSTYPLLHNFVPTWPSLSFDVLRDNDGEERRGYPVSCALVAGTQAQDPTANEITIMRWEGLGKTRKNEEDDSDSEDDEDTEDDPVLSFRAIPHKGCVNRIRARVLPGPLSNGPPAPPEPYHVATFAETGKVHIFDVAPHLHSLLSPATASSTLSKSPIFTIDSHGRAEGYALDWAKPIGSASTSARLLSGDVHSKIFLTTITNTSFTPSPKPFLSHTDSVEDLQWSPSEPTVFASCSADRSIRVWDVRVKDRKSVIGVAGAHESDVNVISWNLKTNYLLASGGDEGGIKVWDLRNFKGTKAPAPTPVAAFSWHTAPITSIEWHPTEDSCFAASGADDQVTLWDLSVEEDEDERPSGPEADRLKDVPAQLLFCHQGQTDIKEVHWHPQVPGTVISTASDGFNIFKALPFSS